MNAIDATSLDSIAHVIQLSLSPIFLLTAVATLLGVFTTRLARISDQVKALGQSSQHDDDAHKEAIMVRLAFLRRRSLTLDVAVILAALSGACTCATVLTLFFAILRDKTTIGFLFFIYGAGILFTLGALSAFLFEVLLASRGIRNDVARGVERLE